MKISLLYEAIGKTTVDVVEDIANDIVDKIKEFHRKNENGELYFWDRIESRYPVEVQEVSGTIKEMSLGFVCYFPNIFGMAFPDELIEEMPLEVTERLVSALEESPEAVEQLNKDFEHKPILLNGFYRMRQKARMGGVPEELSDMLIDLTGSPRYIAEAIGAECRWNPLLLSWVPERIRSMVDQDINWVDVRAQMIKIIDHELGHSKRPTAKGFIRTVSPYEISAARKAGKMKRLRRTYEYETGMRLPKKQLPHERKPIEWDANMHAIIDYYNRLPSGTRRSITYDELLKAALPEQYDMYKAPTWYKKYIKRLNREGIILNR